MPGPTVIVRMKEDVRDCVARVGLPLRGPACAACSLALKRFSPTYREERFTCCPTLHSLTAPAAATACAQRWPRLRAGLAVILLDDVDRENEADLIVAAEHVTVETMALLIRECSGIVCLCLSADRCAASALPPMASENGSRYGTAVHGVDRGARTASPPASARPTASRPCAPPSPRRRARRPGPPRPRVPAARHAGRRAGARRPHRRVGRPGRDGRARSRPPCCAN